MSTECVHANGHYCGPGGAARSRSRMEASPLLEGGEETRIQNVFFRLPSAEPVCQQQGGQLFVAMPAAKVHVKAHVHTGARAVEYFDHRDFAAGAAITDDLADSDTW